MNVWDGVRWEFLSNQSGVGVTGTGMVISRPCQLYELRGVARTAAGYMALYDHTNRPLNPIASLNPGAGVPDPGWRKDLGMGLRNGLYVSFSMGTGQLDLLAGWGT